MLGGAQGQSSMRGYEKFVTPTLQHVKHENGLDTRGEASKIADREEQQAVQKLLADDSMSSISLSAIGIGLLSLVTMLGVRLRRGLQPATILAMPLNTSSALGDNAMEMKSQDSSVKYSAAGAGWGQLSSQNSNPLTPCYATKADLVELQNSLPGPPAFWDPLDLASSTTLSQYGIDTEEKNIGWFRHAEIKHGRVAMAAVLGFIAQCTPIVSGEHTYAPYRGYVAGCTPQEQWDNIPLVGKLQILTLVGMLESYGEGAGSPEGYVHYTKGGKPGYYPPIKGRGSPWGGQILFNLWDPFGISKVQQLSEESKARRLKVELQNGRLAMIGIMGFLAASSVPGSVPFLANIEGYPQYAGNVMVPFSNDFSIGATIYGS